MTTTNNQKEGTTKMQTIVEFATRNKIGIQSEWADHNPNMADFNNMDHWKFTIRMGKKRMSGYFSKGYGYHRKEPNVYEVLSCLASDSAGIEQSFDDWVSDLGHDTEDVRTAQKTYKAWRKASDKLRRFLGDDLYQELLYETVSD